MVCILHGDVEHHPHTMTPLPSCFLQNLPYTTFVKRLPSYWRIDRSQALRIRNGVRGLPLYVTDSVSVFPPESVTAYLSWQCQGVEVNEHSREALDFLDLAQDRRAFLDIQCSRVLVVPLEFCQ
jgi:hypothetical protein